MAIRSYLKDGRKLFLVEFKVRNKFGKQLYKSRQGISSERKAREIEYELRRELENEVSKSPKTDWNAWLADCLKRMKLDSAPSTVINYKGTLEKWASPIVGTRDLSTITRNDIYEIVYEFPPSEYTPNARKDLLKKLKRILQMAVDEGMIERNPAQGMTVRVSEPEKKVLTTDEVEIFLARAKDLEHPFYPIWVTALSTGMRSGELFALQWTDIDFTTSLISVTKQWTSKNGFGPTKNRQTRVVPISSDFLSFLKELKLSSSSQYVLPHLSEWERGEQAKVISEFCSAIGVTPIKFHDLRATFITNMLSHGVSLAKVMMIVGHSEIKTTNVYLRKAGVEIKGATEELGYKIPSKTAAKVVNLFSKKDG